MQAGTGPSGGGAHAAVCPDRMRCASCGDAGSIGIQECNGTSRPAAGCDDVHPGGDLSTYGNGGHKSRGVWARPYR